ncbi:Ubiquinone biosynthesis O-methyltransferase [Rhodoplanes serenus]|uniref:Ubiquinone biosynthesis O-methyltransferase n=1 Tax=Rhodoplanes serenus TaxID=200615 RepID=A0A3S4CGV4_9BRAD|nr:class I SAM-dependent methyltransferase [Rhodoplanes serenus]VCU08836.1 Ubiquinone biosynthesis O-methyltransferase [Rhodoplanes serenus]
MAVQDDGAPEGVRSLRCVHEYIIRHVGNSKARIYEAGGGSCSFLPLAELNSPDVLVVDIDADQLSRNQYAKRKVLGDIQNFPVEPASFDIVVCYNVIEHLAAPDAAIRSFFDALAPGGLLFLAAPGPHSLTGMITKYTPHFVHVLAYKYILGRVTAGQPGRPPFRTVYHPLISPVRLLRFCRNLGFETVYWCEYESPHYAWVVASRPIIGRALRLTAAVLNLLWFGKRDFTKGDYHLLVKKPDGI